MSFSVRLVLFSSMISVWQFSNIFYIFVEILTSFMHRSIDLGEHLYNTYFEFSVR